MFVSHFVLYAVHLAVVVANFAVVVVAVFAAVFAHVLSLLCLLSTMLLDFVFLAALLVGAAGGHILKMNYQHNPIIKPIIVKLKLAHGKPTTSSEGIPQ